MPTKNTALQPGTKTLKALESVLLRPVGKWKDQREIRAMLHGYGIDVDDLITEMNIFQRLFASGKALISVAHVVNELKAIPNQSKKMFPLVLKVIKMLLVVPATSATAERSFSTMKRVKSYLRSAMGQERLNDLCYLCTKSKWRN